MYLDRFSTGMDFMRFSALCSGDLLWLGMLLVSFCVNMISYCIQVYTLPSICSVSMSFFSIR